MSGPTGAQFEIRQGAARAVVTELGAGLRAFEVAGVPYLQTFAEDQPPPMGSGAVLVPWPNRVAGGQWRWQGRPEQLAITEPARGNAIHGLVRRKPWQVESRADDRISLTVDIPAEDGWPVPLRTAIEYTVDDRGLTVRHTVRNLGDEPVPFGVGTHPYPRAGTSAIDACELRLAAATVLPLDPDTMVPSGPAVPVDGTEYDFRTPRSLAGASLDTPFGGCEPAEDGLIHHRLTGQDGGVELWAEPDFRWVQVFLTDGFPGQDSAVAIEPMTCPPDALNSGVDLIVLPPRETWTGRWGIHPLPGGGIG
ncbi:MAG TPA: aldose 1-epimerase family protein [Pseudonocardiaceae bacterium]|nr:aldose 1-epimerase family protein [Pseudonocardiaceae bacterium]